MLRPFSRRPAVKKATANIVSGAVPVAFYHRHGTDGGHSSISAQHERVLSYLAAHTTYSQLHDGTGGTTRTILPVRSATRRGMRPRSRQE